MINYNTGDVVKNWKIIEEIEPKVYEYQYGKTVQRLFLCKCITCEKIKTVSLRSLNAKKQYNSCLSCATKNTKSLIDYSNTQINHFYVIKKAYKNKHSNWVYKCLCDCGNIIYKSTNLLKHPSTACKCYVNTTKDAKDRQNIVYKIKKDIFIRDNYTCQNCNKYGGKLNAHHIFSFSTYKNLRKNKYNLITLCESCHKKIHTKYGNTVTLSMLEDFLQAPYKYRDELIKYCS